VVPRLALLTWDKRPGLDSATYRPTTFALLTHSKRPRCFRPTRPLRIG